MWYLDNAATTQLYPEVIEIMKTSLENNWGNPSSAHLFGTQIREKIDTARQTCGHILGTTQKNIIFTSSATEANNMFLKGFVITKRRKNPTEKIHIITSQIEHPCILETIKFLEKYHNIETTYLPVSKEGLINITALQENIRKETFLISLMAANNETGIIQPLEEINTIIYNYKTKNPKQKLFFHSDVVQYVPSLPFNFSKYKALDSVSLSAHKFGGPKGIGILILKHQYHNLCTPLLHGGEQENTMRSSTENTAGILGMTKALEITSNNYKSSKIQKEHMRNLLLQELQKTFQDILINGNIQNILPGFLSISFRNINGETLLHKLSLENIFLSTGSACANTKQTHKASHVLEAMQYSKQRIQGSIRISLSENLTEKDIQYIILKAIKHIKELQLLSQSL
jgi:cysteine desulfurase